MYLIDNTNSIKTLKQQLSSQIPRNNNNNTNTNTTNTSQKNKTYENNTCLPSPPPLLNLAISNPCKDIIYIGANAKEEYYHVELITDDNDVEYGIQAYGQEAKELYEEINGFTGADAKFPSRHLSREGEELLKNDNNYQLEEEEDEDLEKLRLVRKAINCISHCCFGNSCVLIFKKLTNLCVSKRKLMFD